MAEGGNVASANANNGERKRKARGGRGGANKNVQAAGIKQFSNKWLSQVYAEKPAFPEELFKTTFSKEKLGTLVEALKLATDKEVQDSIRLLEEDYTYSIVVTSHKVPHVPVHLSRITLKHSLQNEESEIALFVKDLKRGRRLDFEPTIQHYENLLRNKNVKYKITVIPVNQLYNEFATFETRRKLAFLYDKFLVDRSVAAHVNGFLGSKMLKKGRLALPVDLTKDALNDEIDQALRKVFYKHVQRGITQNIQVGKHSMSKELIAENIIDLLRQFGDVHPGGYKNVHKLHLRPQVNVSVSIPIYVSTAKPVDGVPGGTTNQEEFTKEQSDKAAELLEDFDINAAGKLVQKRYPSTRLLSDDVLLSDDEKDDSEPLPKRARVATEAGGNQAAPKVPESPKPVKTQSAPVNAPVVNAPRANVPKKRNDIVSNVKNGSANNTNIQRNKPIMNRQGMGAGGGGGGDRGGNTGGQQSNARANAWNYNRPRQQNNDSWNDNNPRNNNRNNFDNNRGGGGGGGGLMNNSRNFSNDDFTRRPNNYNNDGLNGTGDNNDSYMRRMDLLMSAIQNKGLGGGNSFGNRPFNNRF